MTDTVLLSICFAVTLNCAIWLRLLFVLRDVRAELREMRGLEEWRRTAEVLDRRALPIITISEN